MVEKILVAGSFLVLFLLWILSWFVYLSRWLEGAWVQGLVWGIPVVGGGVFFGWSVRILLGSEEE